ncbi:hypothetical protein F66182_4145 [Fusarium sp. NRRL 66182]|nr:hypothetical protein F66182_4145 [Fusarium sp. NRRL 66182]
MPVATSARGNDARPRPACHAVAARSDATSSVEACLAPIVASTTLTASSKTPTAAGSLSARATHPPPEILLPSRLSPLWCLRAMARAALVFNLIRPIRLNRFSSPIHLQPTGKPQMAPILMWTQSHKACTPPTASLFSYHHAGVASTDLLLYLDQRERLPEVEAMDEIHVRVQEAQKFSAQAAAAVQRITPVPSLDYVDQTGICHEPFSSQMEAVTPSLPLFIRPPPEHLDSRDMDYLAHKLCLSIPDPEFRDELLRVYVSVVHPFMPVLNIDDFCGSIFDNDGRDPISLLLFQAVMFVSVTFVDVMFLQSRGYVSRSVARKDFFGRVRILYSLNYESDRMTLVRSLLLLTHWYDAPDDDKDTWYWMGIALTNAQVGGLQRSPEHLKIPLREKRLRRRVWWCCVMRDRLLALGIRSPPRIRDDEYNVKPLTLDDFELDAPSANLERLFQGSKATYPDVEERQSLAVMCIELSSLCLCIGRTLNTLYTVMGNYLGGVEYTQHSTSRPNRSPEQIQAFVERSEELKDWVQRQDANSRYTPRTRRHVPNVNTAGGTHSENMTRIHQAQLRMIYLTALGALHRPQVFCYGNVDGENSPFHTISRENVTDTAVEMAKLAFDLQKENQLRFLPTLAVPAYLAVSLVHLFNTCSDDEEGRSLSLGRLYQCVNVLQQLQDMYSSADYAMQFLGSMLKNTGLQVPWLASGGLPSVSGTGKATANRPSLDMGPGCVAASCMYPSPSTSGNWNQDSADESRVGQESRAPTDLMPAQPPIPLHSAMTEAWAIAGHGDLGDMQLQRDLMVGSPFVGSWCDVDTLLPALLNFEGDVDGSTFT